MEEKILEVLISIEKELKEQNKKLDNIQNIFLKYDSEYLANSGVNTENLIQG